MSLCVLFLLSNFDLFEFDLGFSCSGFSILLEQSLDLTLGFSHACGSLRSTYLGCSFNFCLLHLTVICKGSFETICCILVAGMKPAPWMFSQHMLRELSNCFHPDLLISPGTYWSVTLKLELGFQIVHSAFHTIAKKDIFWTIRG